MDVRFGAALQQFASTVDIVDEAILDHFSSLLRVYLLHELPFNFYEILCEERVESGGSTENGLRTLRVFGGKKFGTAAVQKGSNNHTAYCYVENRPLWITAANGGALKDAEHYVNSWDRPDELLEKLPDYKSGNKFRIRTSIIQPLKDQDRACGVINVESKEHLVPNDFVRDELTLVADAVATMVLRFQAQKQSREGTIEAIEQLPAFVSGKRWTVTQPPKIFVASPDGGAREVVEAIREAVEAIADHEVVVWSDEKHNGTGESRRDMMKGLREARAAVCYLSDESKNRNNKYEYEDNPNVLFEAGIADGLRSVWDDLVLVPIREHEDRCTTPIPFDLQALTVLVVPRDNSGKLQARKFIEQLKERLTWE